jgi:hypothetical protein
MFYQNYLAMSNTADLTGGKPIAVWLQFISGVNAINTLDAFNDIPRRKREVPFFYFVPNTTLNSHSTHNHCSCDERLEHRSNLIKNKYRIIKNQVCYIVTTTKYYRI